MSSTTKILKTRHEIAEELGISTKTIYRKLKKEGVPISRNTFLSVAEQELIYKLFRE